MAGNLVHTLGKGGVVGVGHSHKNSMIQLLNTLMHIRVFHLNRLPLGHGIRGCGVASGCYQFL